MIKYLIILLDDISTSFCHYENTRSERNLIPLDTLKKAVLWGLKENVAFQFLFPAYELPKEYLEIINSVYHASIVPSDYGMIPLAESDVVIISGVEGINPDGYSKEVSYVLRDSFPNLISAVESIKLLIKNVDRLSIVPTDVEKYTDAFNESYTAFLNNLVDCIKDQYIAGHYPQVNVVTDRVLLAKMNNCNAGTESLTLCPDGKFYICPAFYFDGNGYDVGSIDAGLDIRNQQLYKLDHAPICRICDCWQCKRCIWLNRKLTHEVNTPSHQQCVISHLERNASRKFLDDIRFFGEFMPEKEIPELDYLDPIIKVEKSNEKRNWKSIRYRKR